jgi:CubicO group peptidase (beta-lactamase class C family)
MLIGQLVDRGSVNTTSTLEEIFGDEVKWDEVIEGESKKLITLEELLTMTSGLADPDELMDYDESNDPPQESLLDVLNHGEYKDGNEFAYLSSTHILAYVIRSASGGETPAAFATSSSGAFTALGIDKFTWTADTWHTTTNADGMQGSGYGLQMRVRDMAKIGQLYLQEGMSAPSTRLLSAEYVAASMEMKVGPWPNWLSELASTGSVEYCDDATNVRLEGYGYQYWKLTTSDDVKYTCAIGHGGQFICIYPTLDVVVAVTSDSTRDWTGAAGYRASCLVLAQIPDLFKNNTGTEETVAEAIQTGRTVVVIVIIVAVASSFFFCVILPLIILACFCCKKKRATPQPPHPAAAVSMATLPVATSSSSVMPVATPVAVATAVAVPVAATGGAVATATAVA